MPAPIRPKDPAAVWPSWMTFFHNFTSLWLRMFARFCWQPRIRWVDRAAALREVCLYACNHRSFLDPPLVGMFISRTTSYFARRSLWKVPIVREVLNGVGGVPVDRDAPGLASIRDAVTALVAGRNMLIFPEGTRTKTGRLGEMREGPAMIARRAGVPVVPVYVHNTERGWKPGRPLPSLDAPGIEVRFGRPIRVPARIPPRERDRWMTTYLRRWMERQERDLVGPA
jgi:1-acyl-sn-glycerol-3-phosphate acyltransferase